jgi:hypothetical protein
MPEPTITRRLANTRDRELVDDDGPIFSTVAQLVEALQRAILNRAILSEGRSLEHVRRRALGVPARQRPREYLAETVLLTHRHECGRL